MQIGATLWNFLKAQKMAERQASVGHQSRGEGLGLPSRREEKELGCLARMTGGHLAPGHRMKGKGFCGSRA